jgi:nitrogenase molybdenum-iron protein alpha/beta subunit
MKVKYIVTATSGKSFEAHLAELIGPPAAGDFRGAPGDLFALHQHGSRRRRRTSSSRTPTASTSPATRTSPSSATASRSSTASGHADFPSVGYRGGLRLLEKILAALMDRIDRDAPNEKFELITIGAARWERRSRCSREGRGQVGAAGEGSLELACGKPSLAGSVSQRACVFCGSRVVLYPIADAIHLVHGPVGCAAYTWDIRGAVSSGPQLHRLSFSTDLRENDVIFGGEKKLYAALTSSSPSISPKAAFVYSTCIVGIIGDDVAAVCRRSRRERHPGAERAVRGLQGHEEGRLPRGLRRPLLPDRHGGEAGVPAYRGDPAVAESPWSINILGEFNLAGEAWIIREYYEEMGIRVQSILTGDGRVGRDQERPPRPP